MRNYTISLTSSMRESGAVAEFKLLIAELFCLRAETLLFKFITKMQASAEMEKF